MMAPLLLQLFVFFQGVPVPVPVLIPIPYRGGAVFGNTYLP